MCDGSAVIAPLTGRRVARTWFAVTAVAVVVGIAIQLPVAAGATGGFFTDPADKALNVFAFFTIQSNLLVGLSALLTALDPDRDTLLRRVLRLTALVAISVTGIVYHTVLAGLSELSGAGLVADTFVHTVVPVLAVVGWALFGPRGWTSWRVVGLSVVFPLAWLTFTLLRGPLVGGFWPYPFLDVDEVGWTRVLVNAVVVGVGFVALAAAAHGIDRVLTRGARVPAGR